MKSKAEHFADIVTLMTPNEVAEAMRYLDRAISETYVKTGKTTTAVALATMLGWLQEVHMMAFYAKPISAEDEQ